MRRALVLGGLGIVGQGLIEELTKSGEWEVFGLSRRPPPASSKTPWVSVDLLDRAACETKLAELPEITHIFNAAYLEKPTFAEEVEPNLMMLRNAVEVVEARSGSLKHVNLVHGTKAYGTHYGAYKTPARETDPRHIGTIWYYAQEDYIREQSQGKAWSWSILRPRTIYGWALNSPLNLLTNIAAFAAISKELRVPLRFPGTEGGYRRIEQAVDRGLLARAAIFVASQPQCAGEIFNVTNGGHFRWEHMWPFIADCFGMKIGPVLTVWLTQVMADKEPLWARMVQKYNLAPYKLSDFVDWKFGDFQWHADYDSFVETTKIRRFGFHEVVDDEAMFYNLIGKMKSERIIPA